MLILAVVFTSATYAQERSTDELHKFNESVDELIKKVSPSVVQILVTGYGTQESAERGNTGVVTGRQRAIGSGFVIDPSGYIITNAHAVSGGQVVQGVLSADNSGDNSIRSILSTRTNIVPARVVGVSREIDLALLKIESTGKLFPLPLASYRNLHQGEVVLAF
jgi:serine protease Do